MPPSSNAPRQSAVDTMVLGAYCLRGITPEEPFGETVRRDISAWEAEHLPVKGLPRVLRRVEGWLAERDAATAELFRSHTGHSSHLP